MVLLVEKDIRGEICHSIYRSTKAKNKYIKNKDSSVIQYWDVNNLCIYRRCHKSFQ